MIAVAVLIRNLMIAASFCLVAYIAFSSVGVSAFSGVRSNRAGFSHSPPGVAVVIAR